MGGVANHTKAIYLKIKGVCLLKVLKFKRLRYTGKIYVYHDHEVEDRSKCPAHGGKEYGIISL